MNSSALYNFANFQWLNFAIIFLIGHECSPNFWNVKVQQKKWHHFSKFDSGMPSCRFTQERKCAYFSRRRCRSVLAQSLRNYATTLLIFLLFLFFSTVLHLIKDLDTWPRLQIDFILEEKNRPPHPKLSLFTGRWHRYRQTKQQRPICLHLPEFKPSNGHQWNYRMYKICKGEVLKIVFF